MFTTCVSVRTSIICARSSIICRIFVVGILSQDTLTSCVKWDFVLILVSTMIERVCFFPLFLFACVAVVAVADKSCFFVVVVGVIGKLKKTQAPITKN